MYDVQKLFFDAIDKKLEFLENDEKNIAYK